MAGMRTLAGLLVLGSGSVSISCSFAAAALRQASVTFGGRCASRGSLERSVRRMSLLDLVGVSAPGLSESIPWISTGRKRVFW